MSAFEQIQHIKKANITSILQKDRSRRIYHSAVVLVKPISSKREREAPLSWYTPRMLDDMFYILCEVTNKFFI